MLGRVGSKFQFRVLGKFHSDLEGNEDHVTISLLAGPDWEHLSLSGTFTMTEGEWHDLFQGLRAGIPADVRLESG